METVETDEIKKKVLKADSSVVMKDDRMGFAGLTVLITIESGINKKAVEKKLSDMKRKAVSDMKSAKDEAHWLRKMEEAALKDYKSKDISSNRFVP